MMITNRKILLRPARAEDSRGIITFLNTKIHYHRHLDWRTPQDWLDSQPYYLLLENRQILAALACPEDPPEPHWIRLFATSTEVHLQEAWRLLFDKSRQDIYQLHGEVFLAAVALREWFQNILINQGFDLFQKIVVLQWEPQNLAPVTLPDEISFRPLTDEDLGQITDLDNLAFDFLWQHSREGLKYAYLQSAYSTVATYNQKIIGYQISTQNPFNAHLARLAVHPDFQKQNVGKGLVQDLLQHFQMRGLDSITVNTQNDNYASLALYKKMGFHLNDESFPVFLYRE